MTFEAAGGELSSRSAKRANGRQFVELMARRASVPPRRLVAPGPSPEELALIFAAAAAAPSHGGLRNFRFVQIAAESREALATIFVEAEKETNPSASGDDLARAHDKAMQAPTLVLAISRTFPDHPDIPLIEQYVSAGAALGMVLNAAHALEYGGMAVSGEKMGSRALRDAFRLENFEEALCFVALGTVQSASPRVKMRLEPAQVTSVWPFAGI